MTQQKERVKYAHIRSEGPSWFHIEFRFDPIVQQALKDAAGMGNYKWNDRKKKWFVRREHLQAIVDVFKIRDYKVYTNITVEQDAYRAGEERARREAAEAEGRRRRREEARRAEQKKRAEESVWENLFGDGQKRQRVVSGKSEVQSSWSTIFNELDPKIAKDLYRRAILVLHPDKGGDEEVSKALNSAWQEYNK